MDKGIDRDLPSQRFFLVLHLLQADTFLKAEVAEAAVDGGEAVVGASCAGWGSFKSSSSL
jgi:hypothetical protein